MTTNEIKTDAGLIGRCECINKQLEEALMLTIEIAGQHYDEEKINETDAAGLTNKLSDGLQVLALKAEHLMIQLGWMRGQF